MSKLVALLSIPLGFALVKRITATIPKDTTPIVPIIPTLPTTPVAPTPFVPLPPPGPTKFKVDIPEGIVPFFPKQPDTPPKGVTIDPSKFPKIGNIKDLNFQTGFFDPAVQARLRAKQ
jgi:hypothetical protein|tara:strand:- start:589 stop:942 length:354 start_codon:yes stop_codon:yes gene_type:complete